jgi:hypothetical protein
MPSGESISFVSHQGVDMNTVEQKVKRALTSFPKLKENFYGLICNPEHKLSLVNGVSVAPSDENTLRIEALDKEIEIRFNIVSLEGKSPLGEVTAFLINSRDEEFVSETAVLSIWFDHLGNILSPEPTTTTMSHVSEEDVLSSYVVEVIGKIIAQPRVNG